MLGCIKIYIGKNVKIETNSIYYYILLYMSQIKNDRTC